VKVIVLLRLIRLKSSEAASALVSSCCCKFTPSVMAASR
jgi:hypothetical protein